MNSRFDMADAQLMGGASGSGSRSAEKSGGTAASVGRVRRRWAWVMALALGTLAESSKASITVSHLRLLNFL